MRSWGHTTRTAVGRVLRVGKGMESPIQALGIWGGRPTLVKNATSFHAF